MDVIGRPIFSPKDQEDGKQTTPPTRQAVPLASGLSRRKSGSISQPSATHRDLGSVKSFSTLSPGDSNAPHCPASSISSSRSGAPSGSSAAYRSGAISSQDR